MTHGYSGGHGLDLSIAKAIVNQHRGKIWASSILDKSTRFNRVNS
jgi:signal transduction histidine kinase